MFAISNQTYGGEGKLCLLRMKQLLHKRRSSAEDPKPKAQKPPCEADVQAGALPARPAAWSCGTYKWVIAHSRLKWGLSWSPFDESCLSFSQGISYWYSSIKHLEIKIIL